MLARFVCIAFLAVGVASWVPIAFWLASIKSAAFLIDNNERILMALSKVDPDAVDKKQMQLVSYESTTLSINFSRTTQSADFGTVTSLVRDDSNNDVYAGGSLRGIATN